MKQGEIKRMLNLLKLLDTLEIKEGDEVLETVNVDVKKRARVEEIIRILRFDPRITLTMLSRKTGVAVSTLYDSLNRIKQSYDMRLVFVKRR